MMRPQKNVTIVIASALALTVMFMVPAGIFTSSAYADSIEAKARAIQNGVSLDTSTQGTVGSDIDCVGGIDSNGGADSAVCYLVPSTVPTKDYKTQTSQVMTATACPSVGGFTSGEECFSTTWDESNFGPGDYRFVVEFYSNGQLVDLAGVDYRVHTFLVIPESPIGMIAIVGAALAGLGGFYLLRGRHQAAEGLAKI